MVIGFGNTYTKIMSQRKLLNFNKGINFGMLHSNEVLIIFVLTEMKEYHHYDSSNNDQYNSIASSVHGFNFPNSHILKRWN